MKKTVILLFISLLANLFLNAQNFSKSKSINFKENKGQVSDQYYRPRTDILFSGSDGDLDFHLKKDGISYQLSRVDQWKKPGDEAQFHSRSKHGEALEPQTMSIYRVDISWLNTNSNLQIEKGNVLAGFNNYYSECCPNGALNVRSYDGVVYKNIYAGIDLKWYQKNNALKYDYYVAPYADYKNIRIECKGAEKIYVNKKGELILQTPMGNIVEQKPIVTQNGKLLKAGWSVEKNIISFEIKQADPSQALVIDPLVRLWGTYIGGNLDEASGWTSITSDNVGNSYLCGETKSTSNLATIGAFQTTYGGTNANWGDGFLAKFDLNGLCQWATYYGGAQNDFINSCAVDATGNVYISGGTSTTNSLVIATPGAYQSTPPSGILNVGAGGTSDAFFAKLNTNGQRIWGSYYGGTGREWAYCIALNSGGDIIISGTTSSIDLNSIASTGCHQQAYGGGAMDMFLAFFNSSGMRQWGTYYGGSDSGQEDGFFCCFDVNGDIYLGGGSSSTNNIATNGSHQSMYGGVRDGCLAKFNSAGVRQWATYYGGAGTEDLSGASTDVAGNVYVSGLTTTTLSSVMTTPGAHQTVFGGVKDALIIKFNSAGVRQWASYYGGSGTDDNGNCSVDLFGNIYFSGTTTSNSGTVIATACSYQQVYGGGVSDAYLVKFSPGGTRIWGTYYGGTHTDCGFTCSAEVHGNVFLSGSSIGSSGSIIASTNGYQATIGGGWDGFLVKFNPCIPAIAPNTTAAANLKVCSGNSATLSTTCGYWYNTATGTTVLGTGSTFTTGPLVSDSTFYIEEFSCGSSTGTRTAVQVTISPAPSLIVSNSNPTACVNESVTLSAFGAANYTWTGLFSTAPTSTLLVYVLLNSTYTVVGVGTNGCESTATLAMIPNLCLGINKQENTNSFVSIYPNPNNGDFTIQSGSNLNLVLTNELGQTIRTLTLSSLNNFNVELDDLPNGIYFLKGEKESRIVNQKIIVVK